MTQEELAEKVGISRAYVRYVEQERNISSVEVLEKNLKSFQDIPF